MILIAGSQGRIGQILCAAFAPCLGVDRREGAGLRLDLSVDDYDDTGLNEALRRCDAVIHLATPADPSLPPIDHLSAAALTCRLAEACARAGVKRFIVASSDWAAPKDPSLVINAYGMSKQVAETVAALFSEQPGRRGIAVRVGWVPAEDTSVVGAPEWLARNHWSESRVVSEFRKALAA